jgi:hypothetical protein
MCPRPAHDVVLVLGLVLVLVLGLVLVLDCSAHSSAHQYHHSAQSPSPMTEAVTAMSS